MPNLTHLWQRFLQAAALIIGLALGVAATVFGYSNTTPVNVGWSVLHFNGIPLWTVAVVPLVAVLVIGTVYHWLSNFQHFTENVRHRRRVHELEEEVASLRTHMDQLLEMPDQVATGAAGARPVAGVAEPVTAEAAEPEPVDKPAVVATTSSNGGDKDAKKSRKRPSAPVVQEAETIASTDGVEAEPREETPAEA